MVARPEPPTPTPPRPDDDPGEPDQPPAPDGENLADQQRGRDALGSQHANRWLSIYLNDHLAGATAGVALSDRVAGNFRGRGFGEPLARIAREIAEERTILIEMMARLEVRRNALKPIVAATMERVGRVKPNGRFLARSPLSDLVELETLTLGVAGRAGLWRALRTTTETGPLASQLDALLARAERQLGELEAMRIRVADRVLELS